MEVGHKCIFSAVLLHYHPFVAEHGDERYRFFVVQLYTHRKVRFDERILQLLVAVLLFQTENGLQCNTVLLLGDMPVRVELLFFGSSRFLGFGLVTFHEFGKGFVVDAERKRLKVHCPDVNG